jgi:hypothetical protein
MSKNAEIMNIPIGNPSTRNLKKEDKKKTEEKTKDFMQNYILTKS